MSIIIQKPTEMNEELFASILHLLPQLNPQHQLPIITDVTELLSSKSSSLFVARYPKISDPIVGMLTLAIFRAPSGIRAHIEDLVVDREFRNKGIAQALMKEALQSSQKMGANGVMLTSHSRRTSAIRLYENLGFKKWDTNIFFFQFEP